MSKIEVKAANDFNLALNCREQIPVKKGDTVEVNLSSVVGMVDAGQIEQPKGKKFDEMMAGAMTTKETPEGDAGTAGKSLESMNKNELEAYAKEAFGVDLDKRKSKAILLADISVLTAAKAAHEANKEYCESIGDDSQLGWADAPDWQKESAVAGVQFHMDNPDAGDSASHDNWMAQKVADGWVYGEEKDPEAKTHPCMVPFEELPEEQQAKDALFKATVHASLNAE